jgi:tartrate-resistant acid phosphatase type 5
VKYIGILILTIVISTAHAQSIQSLGDLTSAPMDSFCYVVIGDFGDDSHGEKLVADMVKSWQPLFIITTGDNDYEDKNGKSIEVNISQYYAPFIKPNLHDTRFFPCLGNHDQSVTARLNVMDEYFKLFPFLNKAQNYDFIWGPIHFYSINSGPGIPRAVIDPAVLADLKAKSDRDPEPFHIVFFHHPQYSSAYGAVPVAGNLEGYNIDAVLNGHIHYYERMADTIRHIDYITIGCSGRNNDLCGTQLAGNKEIADIKCLDHQNGALKVTVVNQKAAGGKDQWRMTYQYYNVDGPAPLDAVTLSK